MPKRQQSALLFIIYVLTGALIVTIGFLIYLNPWSLEATPASVRCDQSLSAAERSREAGQYDQSEKSCLDALKLLESTNDNFRKSKAYNQLGLLYVQEKKLSMAESNFNAALKYLDDALDKRSATGMTVETFRAGKQNYASIQANLANLYERTNRLNEAVGAYKSALAMNEQYLGSAKQQSVISRALAAVMLKAGKSTEAEVLQIQTEAAELSSKDLMEEITETSGKLNSEKIDRATAIRTLKAIALSADLRQRDVPYVDAETAMARLYLMAGETEKAQECINAVFNFVKHRISEDDDEKVWLNRARIDQAFCDHLKHQEKQAQQILNDAEENNFEFTCTGLIPFFQDATIKGTGITRERALDFVQFVEKNNPERFQQRKLKVSELEVLTELLMQMAIVWQINEQYDKAGAYYDKALRLAIRVKNIGREAEICERIGQMETRANNYSRSEQFYKRALAIQSSVKLSEPNRQRAVNSTISRIYLELAGLYGLQQNSVASELAYKTAFDNDVKYKLWEALTSLGQYYQNRGDYLRAHDSYLRALAAMNHTPDVPKANIQLIEKRLTMLQAFPTTPQIEEAFQKGNQLISNGDISNARKFFDTAERICTKKFGSDSVETAQILQRIGNAYATNHDYDDAVQRYEQAFAIAQDKHIRVTRHQRINLALSYVRRKNSPSRNDDLKKSIPVLEGIIEEIEKETDSLDTTHLITAYVTLGSCYVKLGMLPQAEAVYKKALWSTEAHMNYWHSDVTRCALAQTLRDLGEIYVLQKKFKGAIDCYNRALALWHAVKIPPKWNNPQEDIATTELLLKKAISLQASAKNSAKL